MSIATSMVTLFQNCKEMQVMQHTINPSSAAMDFSIVIPFSVKYMQMCDVRTVMIKQMEEAILKTPVMVRYAREHIEELAKARMRPGVRRDCGAKRWISQR